MARLHGVQAQGTTTPGRLEPARVVLRAGPEPEAPRFQRGKDYGVDLAACLARQGGNTQSTS